MKRENINYVLVGGFVLSMALVLGYGLYRITGSTQRGDVYTTSFQNITGIKKGATVTYEGYEVGNVEAVMPASQGEGTRYKLALNVRKGWRIPEDSVAAIAAPGFLNSPVVEIREGRSKSLLAPGAEIGSNEAGGLMAAMGKLTADLGDLTESGLKPFLSNLQKRFDKLGDALERDVPGAMTDARSVMARLDRTATQMEALFSKENQKHLASILANADQSSEQVLKATAELEKTRAMLDKILQESHGIVAGNRKDITTSVAETREALLKVNNILYHLQTTSRNMNEFSRQLRQNPAALISGKPPVDQAEQ